MPLCEPRLLEKAHIEANKKDAPAFLAEQAVHCLEMVAELSNEGLDFCFKGGNSLLVILEEPKRFSIDVDIATAETRERVDGCVESAVKKNGVFTRVQKRQHKTKPWLPMVSYEIFYPSHFAPEGETFIMLDAVLKASPYPMQRKPVACGTLYRSDVSVKLPTVSSIIADKLLTLGPNTLGIPLGKKKEAQRLKHCHDVALLAEKGPELDKMRMALRACLAQELEIQERTMALETVMQDTLDFCRLSSQYAEEPALESTEGALHEIVFGRLPFEGHLFKKDYSWKRLQRDTAKCGLCMAAATLEKVGEREFQEALALSAPEAVWERVRAWVSV
jgi:hypothetical protein